MFQATAICTQILNFAEPANHLKSLINKFLYLQFVILYYYISCKMLLTTMEYATHTPRLRGSEAGQITESQNHNEHLEFTGIIGIMARAIPVFLM